MLIKSIETKNDAKLAKEAEPLLKRQPSKKVSKTVPSPKAKEAKRHSVYSLKWKPQLFSQRPKRIKSAICNLPKGG